MATTFELNDNLTVKKKEKTEEKRGQIYFMCSAFEVFFTIPWAQPNSKNSKDENQNEKAILGSWQTVF